MASAVKICALCLLLAAHQVMGTAAAASSSSHGGGCIRRVDEASMYGGGSCQCYRKCSHPEEGWLTDASSQRCFVDCVLWQDSVCPSDDDDDGDGVPTAAARRPVPAGLPARMNGVTTVRVVVARPPKVSGSRIDMQSRQDEVLAVEVASVRGRGADDAAADIGGQPLFTVHVNAASQGGEEAQIKSGDFDAAVYVFADRRRSVNRIPIGDKLEKMGADGYETIVVSLHPPVADRVRLMDVHEKLGLTICDVWVEYAPA